MRYREKLNIIIIRDNGPRRSYHIRRSSFILLFILFACLPFLTVLLSTQCFMLWKENIELKESYERFEGDYLLAESRAERLEHLEELLKEENLAAREVLARQLGALPNSPQQDFEAPVPLELVEGPGHEDYPDLDTGRVIVGNVQIRALRGNSIRIGLDLRNPDNEPLLSGEVDATLLTADGERQNLSFSPLEVGNFRISKFKRTVMTAQVPGKINLENAQIILEVRDQAARPIYRNIFAVQR